MLQAENIQVSDLLWWRLVSGAAQPLMCSGADATSLSWWSFSSSFLLLLLLNISCSSLCSEEPRLCLCPSIPGETSGLVSEPWLSISFVSSSALTSQQTLTASAAVLRRCFTSFSTLGDLMNFFLAVFGGITISGHFLGEEWCDGYVCLSVLVFLLVYLGVSGKSLLFQRCM